MDLNQLQESLTSSRVQLWLEVLDGVQVGEVHPALVRLTAVVPEFLDIEAVEQDVHAINLLEQDNDLQSTKLLLASSS